MARKIITKEKRGQTTMYFAKVKKLVSTMKKIRRERRSPLCEAFFNQNYEVRGWMGGWMDACIYGWMDGFVHVYASLGTWVYRYNSQSLVIPLKKNVRKGLG